MFGKKSPKGSSGDIDFEESKDPPDSNFVLPSKRKSEDINLKKNAWSDQKHYELRKDEKERKKDKQQ